jgi:hypothetical protein
MAATKCANCRNDKFELSTKVFAGAHKVVFVQCVGCGTTVGVLNAPPGLLALVDATLQKHTTALRKIGTRLDAVQTMVQQISRSTTR